MVLGLTDVVFVSLLLLGIDVVGRGGPVGDDYVQQKWPGRDWPTCGIERPPEVVATLKNNFRLFEMGTGNDTYVISNAEGVQFQRGQDILGNLFVLNGPYQLAIFETGSAREHDFHDTLIIPGMTPSDFTIDRIGPHLRLCDPQDYLGIVLLRQYCGGVGLAPQRNNQIEEIVFPASRETWLSDAIYDALPDKTSMPDARRIREMYGLGEDSAKAAEQWSLKPFRDVLPNAWPAAIRCRLDTP